MILPASAGRRRAKIPCARSLLRNGSGEARSLGRALTYRVEANAFLQHMVRRIVGALVAVGRGQRSLAHFAETLRAAQRGLVSQLAPPQGLTLEAVRYDEGYAPAFVGS